MGKIFGKQKIISKKIEVSMSRLIKLILSNPLAIFEIIYYWIKLFFMHTRGRKLVVFNSHHDYFIDIFNPIHLELKDYRGIDIYYSIDTDDKKMYSALEEKDLHAKIISNKISPFIPFDLFICSEITGPDFPFKLLKTKKLITYHGNGISGFHKKIDVIKRFDAHFAIGPKFNQFLESIYPNEKLPRIYNVGYPKLDILLQENKLTKKLKQLYKIRADKPTILYAPHWNPFGSLHYFDTKIIDNLVQYDINLLIKPHHYLYAQYPEANWEARLKKYDEKYRNVTLVTRPNTQELYPLADLMISDTGTSAPFEFCILQKPLFVFANKEWFEEFPDEDNSEEEAILAASICFEEFEQFRAMFQEFIDQSALFLQQLAAQKSRQKHLIDCLLYNPGQATEKAVAAILRELDLQPAAKQSEQSRADN
ncbi:MAG: CDP-glycerol glycerophosphotransferase family protein [Candidatus Cloacimonadales bacterium]